MYSATFTFAGLDANSAIARFLTSSVFTSEPKRFCRNAAMPKSLSKNLAAAASIGLATRYLKGLCTVVLSAFNCSALYALFNAAAVSAE